jgi:quercetin dioxygenase-like cupin family protein
MPQSGDRYAMPGAGEYALITSHEDAGGEYVEMEWTLPPGAFAPPPHVHPTQAEEYEVLEGRLDVMVDGRWQTLNAGESASVPVGASHTFRVPADQGVRVRNFHRPGGHFDAFIEKQYRFVTSGRFKGLKRPSTAMVMSMVWVEHADLLVPTSRAVRAAMGGLARLGRLRGYRTT